MITCRFARFITQPESRRGALPNQVRQGLPPDDTPASLALKPGHFWALIRRGAA